MTPVKIGIVGIGNMGSTHARHIIDGSNTQLAAVCDRNPARLEAVELPPDTQIFSSYPAMLESAALDAVIIATPHYDHPDMCLAAFERGLHVLVEKPIAVHISEAQRLIAGYHATQATRPDLVFAAMFNQRTWGHWRKIKAMIDSGALGKLMRCTWLITDWFRTQHYYDSGEWRATWRGEGGGVLMNQCPHNLDLYQWLVGMPARAHGFVQFGKHHRIEVEDEVTAYFEHDDGMVGHFITTTGESPGTNRLEIVGEYGKLVYETAPVEMPAPDPADPAANPDADQGDAVIRKPPLVFSRNARSSIEEIRLSQKGFDKAPCTHEALACETSDSHGHEIIISNFADAIVNGAKLIAPAVEGINMVMLNNAIMLSAHKRAMVALPVDGAEYAALLEQYIAEPPQLSRL